MSLLRLLLSSLLTVVFTGGALAAEDDLFFGELPVFASASRLPQRLQDAPASVSIIDREMIKAMGVRDLNEVLRIVPGFQTFVRNTHTPRVTYHGIPDEEQSSRIQVLIDGRSQFSPLFDGGVNWSLLPVALEDIERIEIVRGSSAASYGGNAFQALVNIVTTDPVLARGTSLSAHHGNQGVRDYTLRHGGKLGEAGDFRLTYQRKQDSGLTDRSDWQDDYQSQMLDWRSDFAVNNQDSLQISAGHIESTMLDGRLGQADSPIHDLVWASTYLQTSWRRVWSANAEIQLRYAFAEDRSSSRYNGTFSGTPFVYDPAGSRATRHEHELVHRFRPFEAMRTVWGVSHRAERIVSPLYFSDTNFRDRSINRLFGNVEWKLAGFLTANTGLAVEKDSIVGWMPSSRASLNWHLSPDNTLRLAAFRSARAGSMMDYSGGLGVQVGASKIFLSRGNADLGRERLSGVELGYLGVWKNLGLHLDVRAFREHIPNRWYRIEREYPDCIANAVTCFYRTGDALKTTLPVQDVHIRGIEYNWSWSPWPESRLVLSQAFVKIESDYLAGMLADPANATLAPVSGNQRFINFDLLTKRSAPTHSTSLLLMQKLPCRLEFATFGQWVGNMKWTTNTSVVPYRRIDVRLAYPFRFAQRAGELATVVQSVNGAHGEFSMQGEAADRIVERRRWLSLRFDL